MKAIFYRLQKRGLIEQVRERSQAKKAWRKVVNADGDSKPPS